MEGFKIKLSLSRSIYRQLQESTPTRKLWFNIKPKYLLHERSVLVTVVTGGPAWLANGGRELPHKLPPKTFSPFNNNNNNLWILT